MKLNLAKETKAFRFDILSKIQNWTDIWIKTHFKILEKMKDPILAIGYDIDRLVVDVVARLISAL